MNCVYALPGMEHHGHLVADTLGWPLYIGTSVGKCDTCYIIGLYDPPTYHYTLSHTQGAARRIIQFFGSDLPLLAPQMLPGGATYLVETEAMRAELWERAGIDSKIAMLPTLRHFCATPFPDKPAIAFYTGSNPPQYGSGVMEAIDAAFPDLDIFPYGLGQYDAEQMQALVDKTTICMRLPLHDGAAASAREFMEAGRRAIVTIDMPHAVRVSRFDVPGIFRALRRTLRETEPDTDAAAHYAVANSPARYLADLEGVL